MRVKWNRNLDGFYRVDPRNGYTTLRSSRHRLPNPLNDDYAGYNEYVLPTSGQEKKAVQRCGILHILKCRECCADPAADQGTRQSCDVNDNSSHGYTRLCYQELTFQNCKPDGRAQKCPTLLLDNDNKGFKHGGDAMEEYGNDFKMTKKLKSTSSNVPSDVEPISSISSVGLQIFSADVPSISGIASDEASPRAYLPTLNNTPKHSANNSPRLFSNRNIRSHKTKPRYLKIENTIGLGRLSPLTKQEAEIISARRSAFMKKNQRPEDVSSNPPLQSDGNSYECVSSNPPLQSDGNSYECVSSNPPLQSDGNSSDCVSSNPPLHRSCDDNSSYLLSSNPPLKSCDGNSFDCLPSNPLLNRSCDGNSSDCLLSNSPLNRSCDGNSSDCLPSNSPLNRSCDGNSSDCLPSNSPLNRSCDGNSSDCLPSNPPLNRNCDDNSSTGRCAALPLVFFHGSSKSVKDNNLAPPPGYKIMRIKPRMSSTLPMHLDNPTETSSRNILIPRSTPHVFSSSQKEAVHFLQDRSNSCCENNDGCSKSFCNVETHHGQTVLQASSDLKPTFNFGNVESPYDTREVRVNHRQSYKIPRATNVVDSSLRISPRIGQLYQKPLLCQQRNFTVSKVETGQAPCKKSNQGQAKVRSSLAPSITGERRKTQGEYLLEIQRLEALCETRTKELNWLKLQLKHATLGFDSLTVLIKYLADDLDAFSNPRLANEVEKSREDLRKTETQLNQYQEEVEHLKKCHTKEVVTLREELDLVHKDELARLVFKHEKEVEELKNEYHEKVVGLTETHAKASKEVQEKHSSEIQALKEQHKKLLEDLEKNFTVRLKDMEQSHEAVVLSLREQNHKLQQQLEELQQEKQSVEDALKQDTDSKIQLIMNQKTDLKKEVESLKTVLEMKKCEIQNLRTENLKMQKDLEELPVAKEQVEKLKARNEDLQARVDEKVEQERQLSCEQVKLRESYEKESKVNKRLSMEKEELVWKLKQTMEASILLSSPTGDTPAIDRLDQLAKDYTLRKSPIRMSVFFDTLDANSSYYKHSSPGQKSGHLASPRTRSLRQGSNSSPSTPNKKRRPRSLETEKSPERKVSTMADVKICLKYNEDECQQGTQEDNTQDLSKTFPIGDVELTPTEEIVEVVSQAPVHKEQYSNELPEKHQEAPKICTATAVLSENSDLATDSLREELMQETMESPKTMTDVQKTTTILLCSGDSSSSTSSNVEQYDIVKQVHIRTKSIDQPSGAGEQLATTLVSAGIPEVDGSWQGSMTSSGSSWSMGLDVGDNKEIAVEEHAEKVNDFNESSEDRSESSSEQDDYPVAPRCLAGEAMIPEESPPSITESSSEGSPVSKRPCHKDKQDSSVKLIDGTEESSDGIFTLDDGEQGPLQEGNDVNWCDDDLPSETEV